MLSFIQTWGWSLLVEGNSYVGSIVVGVDDPWEWEEEEIDNSEELLGIHIILYMERVDEIVQIVLKEKDNHNIIDHQS